MKLASLFSGGKDSVYATYLAKKEGNIISCLISIVSKNPDSYMFHTPAIDKTVKQAEVMQIPLIITETSGEKEEELKDLKIAIKKAKDKYKIDGVVTGAIRSVYQASRIQKICDELNLVCINPLWQKKEREYLTELIKNSFKIILVSVAAYPLNSSWLLREINEDFIREIEELNKKFKIHVAGEGGEFETFVLNCPMYKHELKVISSKITSDSENSARAEIEVE